MPIAKAISRVCLVAGFSALLYYVIFAQAKELPTDISPSFQFGFILIVIGIVANTFVARSGDQRRARGFRVSAVGFGLAATGILLESHPSISGVMIVIGFIVFGGGLLIALPSIGE